MRVHACTGGARASNVMKSSIYMMEPGARGGMAIAFRGGPIHAHIRAAIPNPEGVFHREAPVRAILRTETAASRTADHDADTHGRLRPSPPALARAPRCCCLAAALAAAPAAAQQGAPRGSRCARWSPHLAQSADIAQTVGVEAQRAGCGPPPAPSNPLARASVMATRAAPPTSHGRAGPGTSMARGRIRPGWTGRLRSGVVLPPASVLAGEAPATRPSPATPRGQRGRALPAAARAGRGTLTPRARRATNLDASRADLAHVRATAC